jgi:molybdopterin synthase sulfur carrier subunit
MIRVLFFGRLGEYAENGRMELTSPPAPGTAAALRDHLGAVDAGLGKALAEPQVMVAVNQEVVDWDSPIHDGDEVAFLPPVTGG